MSEKNKKQKITFKPSGLSYMADTGMTIFEIANKLDIAIRSECGGKGFCGKCKVLAEPDSNLSPVSEAELNLIGSEEIAKGFRLACQSKVLGPVTVTIPDVEIVSQEIIGKTDIKGSFSVDPMVERLILDKSIFADHQDKDDYHDVVEKISDKIFNSTGKKVFFKEIYAIRDLAQPSIYNSTISAVYHKKRGITAIVKGENESSLGIAIDIGTTTVAVYLCDIKKGIILTSFGSTNPQRRYGEDVISRIAFANEQSDGIEILHKLIIQEINALIGHCLKAVKGRKEDIDEVVVVGNPTMEQIFTGIHPHNLGIAPYLPISRSITDFRAIDIGIDIKPGTNVHVFPVISGFVGGDTLGAIISQMPHKKDEITLIIDIGTNGELVLGNRSGLWATSCATGPALEGSHISCGMRAAYGAIYKVSIDPSTYKVYYELLGDSEKILPKGICGSGIIDAIASMRRAGLILENGRLNEDKPGIISDADGIGRKFVLVPKGNKSSEKEIYISLMDIRQIQLAKAAILTGIKMLMRKSGITHIDKVVLTGAFGAKFNWKNAVTIGMLPDVSLFNDVNVVENGAGVGAIMALLDKKYRDETLELLNKIRFIELAKEPDFQVEYTNSLAFPPIKDKSIM
ncbi:MAG: hypothetical protein DRP55_05445 [Spirochaetes bacterium]|nr:MAG: hypothetical protein DRP55_05445 [Spirochaetota bacterium]